AGKIIIEQADFDLHALVNGTVQMLSVQGTRKGISVSSHIDPKTPFLMVGDAVHLRQVLVNLLGNAVKFTDHGSVAVRVRVAGGTSYRPLIRFEVEDTGIGIPADKLDIIFNDFTQADTSTTREFGGSGLGTTIARQLVELMGGQIGVESTQGVGSTFWFEVPIMLQKQAAHDGNDPQSLQDTRVLLLASERQAAVVREDLRAWGVDFDWVTTAARSFSLLVDAGDRERPYSAVRVDQGVLDMKPEQYASIVRQHEMLGGTSLVLIATEILDPLDERRLERFYSAVLPTPLDKRLLFNSIHAAHSEHAYAG